MTSNSWLKDLTLLMILLGILFGTFLGSRSLSVPDEGRYAEIPREMLISGDFVTPRVNAIKYFEKPPFFYWLQAGAIKLFGSNDWSVRLITAFMALLTCLFTYFTARKFYGRTCGWFSSLILATSIFFFSMAHFITLDMALTALLTGCLFSFILGTHEPSGKKRDYYMWSMYVFAALATLTKGFIGVVFPGMIIFVWMLLFNDWRNLKTYCLPTGILIWLIITLPWHILVQWRNPEFFHFYVIQQHFARYLTTYAKREQAVWFLPATLIVGFFPWITFLPQAIKQNLPKSWQTRANEKTAIFLILWAGLIYLFFQFSHSQLPPYILPIFPPLAILVGRYFVSHVIPRLDRGIQVKNLDNNFLDPAIKSRDDKGITIGFTIIAALSALAAISFLLAITNILDLTQLLPKVVLKQFFSIAIIFLIAASIALLLSWKHQIQKGFSIFIIGIALGLIVQSYALTNPVFNPKSTKTIALTLNPLLKPDDTIVSYHTYYQDLPFYTQRRIVIVGWGDNELDFGITHQDMQGWFLDDKTFWKRWREPKRMFMILSKNDYNSLLKNRPGPLYLLAETDRNVLVANQRMN